jgi:hypothetical protein
MKKVNIDGLLALKLEEIEIIYRRCRGDTVQKVANDMHIGASTIHNERMPEILKLLEVENWKELESLLCVDLRRTIPSLDALQQGWPEAFREKIETLRAPIEHQTQAAIIGEETPPVSLPSTNQSESQSRADSEHSASIPPVSGSEAESISNTERQETRRAPFPWYFIAIPVLIVCLLCGWAFMFGRGMLGEWFSRNNATATLTLAPQVPPNTETSLPTDIPSLVASETSLPTASHTAAPPTVTSTSTNTPQPTQSPTSSVPALFFDDFNNGKSVEWQLISGDEPVIVNGSLTFEGTTTNMIIDQEWTDYELSFYVSNMQCQEHVGSRGLTVGLRVQDANNMVALRINDQDYCGGTWGRIQNSEFDSLPTSNFKLPPVDSNQGRQITIRVQGNTYSTPIGTSVVIENYATGGIAFIGAQGVTVDNVRVTQLTP